MKVWGLTGNIACGKSLVEALLRDRGVPVIDADQVAREVVRPGTPGLAAVVEAFGTGVLRADGSLDRKALGAVVFADPDKRKQLEAITHPAIGLAIGEKVAALSEQGHGVAVVSAALMVESGSYRMYAGLAVVTCPEAEQLARLMKRDGSAEAEARARIEAQLPQLHKAALADVVIDNGGRRAQTEEQVQAWFDERLAGR